MMRALPNIGFATLLLLAGCTSPKTILLTLDTAPPAADTVRLSYRGLPIAVPAVHLPASLDRAEFVHQEQAGEVKVDDFARWTAPLGLLARDALVRDLTARLPAGSVLPPGISATQGTSRMLDVAILSLQPNAGGTGMQVAYRSLPDETVHQLYLTTTTGGPQPAPSAQAFSVLIGQLADRIVQDLTSVR